MVGSIQPNDTPQRHREVKKIPAPSSDSDNYTWHTFHEHLRLGSPLVITGCTTLMQRRYNFDYFANVLHGIKIKTVHILDSTNEELKDGFTFFRGIVVGDPATALWKVKV